VQSRNKNGARRHFSLHISSGVFHAVTIKGYLGSRAGPRFRFIATPKQTQLHRDGAARPVGGVLRPQEQIEC
jgi:hypothetical protein